MNVNCEIVQDLLPLYEDGLCSPSSLEAVEEHLKNCPNCRAQAESVRKFQPQETSVPIREEDKAVARSFRKVRRRWWASLIAVLLVVPLVWMCVNQYRREGLCFTNMDDVLSARRYAAALAAGDWERAAERMDYERLYDEVQEVLSWDLEHYIAEAGSSEDPEYHYEFNQSYYAKAGDMTETEFEEYVKSAYIRDLKLLEANGYSFRLAGFEDSYYIEENGGWIIIYGLNVSKDSQTRRLSLHILVREGGLSIGAMSDTDLPGEKIDLAEILFLGYPSE